MSVRSRLKVVLYWHMHQPEYRNFRTGKYVLPWTYLHGIKDYVDMAAHLEKHPKAYAVVNFAPVLLEQISDYVDQLRNFLHSGTTLNDPLLSVLAECVLPDTVEERIQLIRDCLRANEERLINRFPAYRRLADLAPTIIKNPDIHHYISDQYLVDLVVWHHLAWLAETVRRTDPRIKQLMDKQHKYSLHDRRLLVEIITELLDSIIPRYRALAQSGQVELSMTPYAHPIVPLLLDINSAREAMPEVKLPTLKHYPGGEERVHWHFRHGREVFKKYFGLEPKGCWPSEGSVSDATLKIIAEEGFLWTASGGSVLNNSQRLLAKTEEHKPTCIHSAYQLQDVKTHCFFRDDGLSDLIGFTYSTWHADDAVANLVHHLENIAVSCKDKPDAIVSIILDGENAWEYYPENGYYFLDALYRELSNRDKFELTTYSRFLAKKPAVTALPGLVAGSWVYGTFSTWIGDKDKNRGWDMLGDAKRVYDRVISSGRLSKDQVKKAENQLAICEGSDWFWWFGDYNPADSVSSFEHLFRINLSNLYTLLGEEPPEYIAHSFTHGSGNPAMGGTMRPGQEAG